MPHPHALTIAQTCQRIGRSRWTVTRLIKAGLIAADKHGDAPNAAVLVDPDSVAAYISTRDAEANA